MSAGGEDYRRQSDTVTLFGEHARFVGRHTLELAESGTITADRFVIAAGARPVIPDLPGLDSVVFHTSDTVMHLDRLPTSMVILGGGYVAAEFAHIFSAYGVAVTIVVRSDRLLRHEDDDVSARFTELFAHDVDVRLSTTITAAGGGAGRLGARPAR